MTCNHEELRHYSDGDSIAVCGNQKPCPVHEPVAALKAIRKAERNARQKAVYQAHLDCGLVKTPYGWE